MSNWALTEDEASAGVGSILDGTYDAHYYSSSYGYPENHGKSWSVEDLKNIETLFMSGSSIDYIANSEKRTCHSIAWQLYHMGLITEAQRIAVKNGLTDIEHKLLKKNKLSKPIQSLSNLHVKELEDQIKKEELERKLKLLDKLFDDDVTEKKVTKTSKNDNKKFNLLELIISWTIIIIMLSTLFNLMGS
jgi:hypothetical protein